MTPEELQEIERLDREATPGPWLVADDVPYDVVDGDGVALADLWTDKQDADAALIVAYRTLAPRLAADYRAAVALAEHIQTDLEAMHRANARAEATIADLREDLARARLINTQAEKVRDENERLRRDLAAVRAELQALHDVLSGARVVAAAEGRAAK